MPIDYHSYRQPTREPVKSLPSALSRLREARTAEPAKTEPRALSYEAEMATLERQLQSFRRNPTEHARILEQMRALKVAHEAEQTKSQEPQS